MIGSRILGAGHYQPERVVDNHELAQMVETDDEWIQRRVGIKERRWAADDETVDEMATKAATMAIQKAGIDASTIDMVVVATVTALDRCPNMAARVAEDLQIPGNPATIDINTACSGFSYSLAIAQQAIAFGSAKTALVIASEKLTAVTDMTDRSTCILTADGAGAVIVSAADEQTISPVVWGSVPEMGDAVQITHFDDGRDLFSQNGQAVFRWTTTELPKIAKRILEQAKVDPADLGAIVLHQANLRIIEPLARKIGAPNAVVSRDVAVSGNTSAASVPLALSKLLEEHPLPSGTPILLFAFGGGLTYAGQVIQAP